MEQEKTVSEKTVQKKINVAFGARQVVVELSQAAVCELARRSMPLMVQIGAVFQLPDTQEGALLSGCGHW
jgi:hypothetical protein